MRKNRLLAKIAKMIFASARKNTLYRLYRHRSALERSARLFYNIIKDRKPLENRRFSLRADRF